ncbi:DUF4258 domain-containing protein [Patescibacteria group bacterium]|nr:DUF4258 domain-containing protein [Patescibacteria group bacterium]
MPIQFSKHALYQLKKRNISKKRVIEVVKNPEEIKDSYKNRRLRRKVYGGKILQVITATEGSRITVVSGYYLKLRK